ncbi:MAG: FkbM family methyltransferase [Vicinamibacterales bacterium]
MPRARVFAMRCLAAAASALLRVRAGRALGEEIVTASLARTRRVTHNGTALVFAVPNRLTDYRARTLSSKEPETLDWLDSLPHGSVLWDIGANVGLYSCYAAKARGCRVIAFEPSVFNLEVLARNVHLNGLTGSVTIVAAPLFSSIAHDTLNMTSTQWGGALSTFSENYGSDGAPLESSFQFRTVGISMDTAISTLAIPAPDYIKMDVDGIEHVILRGGAAALAHVKSIAIEINDAFEQQAADCARLLRGGGLQLVSKRQAARMAEHPDFARTFNQVWSRPPAS